MDHLACQLRFVVSPCIQMKLVLIDIIGNPEINTSGYGWQIFNAILGWNNTGTYGSVLAYIFYWLAVTVALVYLRFKETRGQGIKAFAHLGRKTKEKRAIGIEEKSSTPRESLSTGKKSVDSPVVEEISEIEVPEVK